MSMISIIVASRFNIAFLKRLFTSLQSQSYKNFEVLICATNPEQRHQQTIRSFAGELNYRIVATPKHSIASARNQGIKVAKGEIVFFLDEDCYLPRRNYLQQMTQFHQKRPTHAAGGFYLSETTSTMSDQFYNYMCNAWAKSYQKLKTTSPVLLGGCCFYPRQLLQQNKISFDERNSRAGEEYLLNSSWADVGLQIQLSSRWSVFHQPKTSLYGVFRKSWTQGAQLQPEKVVFQLEQLKRGLGFLYQDKETKLIFLPMLGLYGAIGRASFLTKLATKFYNHNKCRTRKKYELPASIEKFASRGVAFSSLANKKSKTVSKKQEHLKINVLKNTQLIKKSVKIKAEPSIYKN